jgi:hypothetical protein
LNEVLNPVHTTRVATLFFASPDPMPGTARLPVPFL